MAGTRSVVVWSLLRLRQRRKRKLLTLMFLLVFCAPAPAQEITNRESQSSAEQKQSDKIREADLRNAERRTFAISSVTALANEARSYDDLMLRTRVLARAADTLWEVDDATARSLFRRAWEVAEEADGQELTLKSKDSPPAMVVGLRRISGHDLRTEVLTLAAGRDRAMGEEFLAKLKDDSTRRTTESGAGQRSADPWLTSEQVSKRLLLARNFIDDGQVELGLEVATPVLNEVNAQSINFLSALREKRADVADQRFALLLGIAERDPLSDANTVSGLSSYVFSPGFYITFFPDGGSRWTQPEGTGPAPSLPATLRRRFFQTAAAILLRPVPPVDQDFSTTGRLGKYMVVKRLLPFFELEAPETAAMLRSQLTTLVGDLPRTAVREDNSRFAQGLNLESRVADPLEMQERLDHAGSSRERDEIYADVAVALAHQGNARAQELADKIEDSARRLKVRQYVDLQLVQAAFNNKMTSEVVRLAQAGQLTHTQRVWAYTQAAKILRDSDRVRAAELLAEATEEARLINADDPDRPRSLVAVATGFVTVDPVRSWELLGEAVKAANSVETFTGESEQLTFGLLATKTGIKMMNIKAADFSLNGLINSLAAVDLTRTTDLAKSFKNAAPRATAILATARAVLNRKTALPPPKEKN